MRIKHCGNFFGCQHHHDDGALREFGLERNQFVAGGLEAAGRKAHVREVGEYGGAGRVAQQRVERACHAAFDGRHLCRGVQRIGRNGKGQHFKHGRAAFC